MEQEQVVEVVTNIDDIAIPVELVTLKHLKTKGNQPVRVRCEAVDEVVIAAVMRGLPGMRPKSVEEATHPQSDEEAFESVSELNALAPALLEAGTALLGPGGRWVRPAFYFDETKPRDAFSIPGRLLRVEDKSLMVEAILRVGGYLPGGQADEGAFHGGERVGNGDGVGVVPARGSKRSKPVGGAAR